MDVVIIGAGLSGLTAATTLHEAGISVQILEADAQIGGRIRSLRDNESNQAIADLGPTWVWPKHQPVVARWISELDIKIFEQFNEGNAVIMGYGPKPLFQPMPGQDGMVRIVGGPTTLIDTFAARLGSNTIRTGAVAIGLSEDGPKRMHIHLDSGEIITAQRVIVAAPLRVVATTIRMPWAPQSLLEAMRETPTWMSSHAKAVIIYDRPFWRDAGLSGRIVSRTGPLVEVHDHTCAEMKPGALFGFVGWSPERRHSSPDQLRQEILAQLSNCLGKAAANPLQLVIKDWATNSGIVNKLDLAQPVHHPNVGPDHLREKYLDGRVQFAVSEVSKHSPGLIEGALAIGESTAINFLNTVV